MSDNVEKTPEARWRHLREAGKLVLINLKSNDLISEKPSWFDEERFKLAKETVQKHYIGISYSSLTGLLLILQLPDGLEPLLSTGNSKDIPSLYKRYLSTIVHVNSWYDDDVFDPETKGYKSIRQVRAMHKHVQTQMNEKFSVKDVEGKERKWMSQYDMSMTQFAFIGLAMLFPQKSGMIAATHEDLELINYYWRVLGYLMGIEDEYNACQFDKYEDIREIMSLIFEREYKDNFKKLPCEKGLEMTKSICVALHFFTPLITFNNLAHWWKDCFLFNGYEPQPQTTREKLLDCWTRVSFNHLLKYESVLGFSNRLHRKRFQQRLLKKDQVYEKLKAEYKDNTKTTYYSDRQDYFNKSQAAAAATAAVAEKEKAECLKTSQQQDQQVDRQSVENESNNNNNNNNTDEIVYSKAARESGCPFGYSSNHEATAVSA